MATNVRQAGRPITVAIIGSPDDIAIALRDTFFSICNALHYKDKVHLANGLGVTFRTVENWYYGWRFPDEQTARDVINWYNNGKPVKKILQCESLQNLL